MSTNAFEDSVLKDVSRYQFRRRILDQFPRGSRIRGFTLPGSALAFEEDLAWDYRDGLQLYGVEQVGAVYDAALKKIERAGIPMTLSRENDLNYWERSATEKLDFVWLDYCAMWNSHQRRAIEAMLANGHLNFDNGNPLVALTVLAAREPSGELVDEIYADHLSKGGRPDEVDLCEARRVGIPRAINRSARGLGFTFVPQFVVYYRDAVRARLAQPMMLFVFEVFRGDLRYNENRVPFIHSRAWLEKDITLH